MELRPRHLVLFAVVIAIFVFNVVRHRHSRPEQVIHLTESVPTAPENTAAWDALDKAAALKDAPDAQFQTALQTLQQQIEATQPASAAAGLKGCKTWLLFYRQGVVHPSSDPAWHTRSAQHLDACVKTHRDSGQ